MNKILRLASVFIMLWGGAAYGGSCEKCVVESIASGPSVNQDCPTMTSCALIRVNATGGVLSSHPCATSAAWHFVIDLSNPESKNTYSLLLTAQATKQKVVIGGSNTCEGYVSKNVEDFTHMYFSW